MIPKSVISAVNIGNTTTSAAIFVGGSLVRTTRVPTLRLREIWRIFGRAAEDFRERTTAIVVGSVVPSLNEAAAEIASREFDVPARFYRVDIPAGIELRVEQPERVGDDRVANALAAYRRFNGPAVVVDMGTAITVDVVSDDGAFLGGAIMPGAGTCAKTLAKHTALLPHVDLAGEPTFPGKTTEAAVRSGLMHGVAGAVDRLVEMAWEVLGTEAPVIGTGGETKAVAPVSKHIEEIEPALTLEGLARAVEFMLGSETQAIGIRPGTKS